MSVNYHAAQSRGVLFENHEKVSEQWRQEFSQYDPARIKNTLHLETDEEYLYTMEGTGQKAHNHRHFRKFVIFSFFTLSGYSATTHSTWKTDF